MRAVSVRWRTKQAWLRASFTEESVCRTQLADAMPMQVPMLLASSYSCALLSANRMGTCTRQAGEAATLVAGVLLLDVTLLT